MLLADKRELQNNLKVSLLQIEEKELNYYTTNCMTVGTQAAMLAGFAFAALIEVDTGENQTGRTVQQIVRDDALTFVWYVTAVLGMLFETFALVKSMQLSILAPGLALRGPEGSMTRALVTMRSEYHRVHMFFYLGLLVRLLGSRTITEQLITRARSSPPALRASWCVPRAAVLPRLRRPLRRGFLHAHRGGGAGCRCGDSGRVWRHMAIYGLQEGARSPPVSQMLSDLTSSLACSHRRYAWTAETRPCAQPCPSPPPLLTPLLVVPRVRCRSSWPCPRPPSAVSCGMRRSARLPPHPHCPSLAPPSARARVAAVRRAPRRRVTRRWSYSGSLARIAPWRTRRRGSAADSPSEAAVAALSPLAMANVQRRGLEGAHMTAHTRPRRGSHDCTHERSWESWERESTLSSNSRPATYTYSLRPRVCRVCVCACAPVWRRPGVTRPAGPRPPH